MALSTSSVQPRWVTELFADFGCWGNLAFGDDGDAGFGGNAPCVNIKNRPVFCLERFRFCIRIW